MKITKAVRLEELCALAHQWCFYDDVDDGVPKRLIRYRECIVCHKKQFRRSLTVDSNSILLQWQDVSRTEG